MAADLRADRLSRYLRLLDYMGSSSNGVNPMDIKFHIDTNSVKVGAVLDATTSGSIDPASFNISFDYCHLSSNGSTACSCQDCNKSCKTLPDTIVDPEPCLIMGKVKNGDNCLKVI